MNIKELRVRRLKQLVSEDGGIIEFVRKRSQPSADKPIDPTYVSQLLNGHRSFGEKAAETMCRRAGLDDGYFDREASADLLLLANQLSGESLSVARMFDRSSEDVRKAVLTFLRLSADASRNQSSEPATSPRVTNPRGRELDNEGSKTSLFPGVTLLTGDVRDPSVPKRRETD